MATDTYFYLRPLPMGANYYREAHPYGPDGVGGFNTAIAIEIDSAHLTPFAEAIAVVGGLVRFIPDPNQTTGTLVLKPDPLALMDLSATLHSTGSLFFLYRNLDLASVRTAAVPVMQALGDAPFIVPGTPQQRAGLFTTGSFAIAIRAGATLGNASTTGGAGGWARLGFEIVHTPGGLGPTGAGPRGSGEGWARLRELIDPAALTRRLDPTSFYASLASGTGPAHIVADHASHALLAVATRRTLLEIRDEYDLPFTEAVTVQAAGASPITAPAPAGSRGTFVLGTAPPVGPPNSVNYNVTIPNRVLTELPSGSAAQVLPMRPLMPPVHWALQAITMEQFLAPADEPQSWLVANIPPLSRYTENNKITPIRDGVAAFREFTRSMRTVNAAGHFIYLAAWRLIDNFPLIDGDLTSTFSALTNGAAISGAQVRALLWDKGPGTENSAEVDHINALPGGFGQAILDNETLVFGSHHQKFLIVNGSQGAWAFCGGLDINTDRRDSPNHGAQGAYHDVHAKVEGPAVGEIYGSFVDRWNHHPSNRPDLSLAPPPFVANAGSTYVQVACTYPPSKAYPFAPLGSLTPLNAFLRAVSKARRFIYIEDQYLTPYPGTNPATGAGDSVGVLAALRAALPRIDYLIIVIPNHWDQPQGRFRRQQFIEGLRAVAPDKVHVFFLGRQGPRPGPGEVATEGGCGSCSGGSSYRNEIYCHTKSWIVDDICAKIGSCNVNRRSLTHDSEMDIVMVDGALDNGARAFARLYRLELWGEHLNMTGARNALLEDYKLARWFWLNPPPGARIRPYNHNIEIESVHTDVAWNRAEDPDGR